METIEEYPRTPEREDCVKRLFGDAAGEGANTSEYFSQSSEENGGASSASNQPFSSPDPEQVIYTSRENTAPPSQLFYPYT